jgi:gamma-glutamyltranspeptidase/glutathione hydrolase
VRRRFLPLLSFVLAHAAALAAVPPQVEVSLHAIIVAGHPEAAEAGLSVLNDGGNAMDAAVAVSLSLEVAEPYASGLGGKLELLYYDASTRKVSVVDGMDCASRSLNVAAFLALPAHERNEGGASAAVPGLAAGLYEAHRRWGARAWSDDVQPARALAERGSLVLPKTVALMAESRARFAHDAEARKIYLPGGRLPAVGSRLRNPDLAATLGLLAAEGPAAIYQGRVAGAIVSAVREAGGSLTLEDLAGYRARMLEPLSIPWGRGRLFSAPPPAGGEILLAVLGAVERRTWSTGPLRTADNLEHLGAVFRAAYPLYDSEVGDVPVSRARVDRLLAPDALAKLGDAWETAALGAPAEAERPGRSTTHFIVVDRRHNIVCVTQSLSLHFGCGIVPPGTGIVLNDTLSDFTTRSPANPNYVAAGRRPRSTIAPSLWLDRDGNPLLAIGLPGGGRIPTGLAQVLIDLSAFRRPLADAIGDTRVHFLNAGSRKVLESEVGLDPSVLEGLRVHGWTVTAVEAPGTGEHFGGVNAVEFLPDGSLRGDADIRRTNAAAGN